MYKMPGLGLGRGLGDLRYHTIPYLGTKLVFCSAFTASGREVSARAIDTEDEDEDEVDCF